jgi:hypothetical protein
MFKMGTDVVLEFQDGEIESHRCLLAQISPVFASMFFAPMPMAESIHGTVKIANHSKESMKVVLEAIDGAILMQNDSFSERLTLDNVRPIIHMLHEFQIEKQLHICDTFLENSIILKNTVACGDDLLFAQTFQLEKFLGIVIQQLKISSTLLAFVNESGEKLDLNSWKIITQCQSSDHHKLVELQKAAKEIFESTSTEWSRNGHREPGSKTMDYISLLKNHFD